MTRGSADQQRLSFEPPRLPPSPHLPSRPTLPPSNRIVAMQGLPQNAQYAVDEVRTTDEPCDLALADQPLFSLDSDSDYLLGSPRPYDTFCVPRLISTPTVRPPVRHHPRPGQANPPSRPRSAQVAHPRRPDSLQHRQDQLGSPGCAQLSPGARKWADEGCTHGQVSTRS